MMLARVAYDAYNQRFRLADPEMAPMFEDGEVYVLVVDFLPKTAPENGLEIEIDTLLEPPPSMGHA